MLYWSDTALSQTGYFRTLNEEWSVKAELDGSSGSFFQQIISSAGA